jgi:hypothetical protein
MMKDYMRSLRFVMEDRKAEARAIIEQTLKAGPPRDPCARYYTARAMAGAGVEGALAMLASSVDGGFSCFDFMARDPWLASLQKQPEFSAILRRSEARERHARAAYIEAGGDRVLGVDA